jgi:hypothetical protein
MRKILVRASCAVALPLLALTACASTQNEHEAFREALEQGASCAELFELRNDMDRSETNIDTVNAELREVGCYSSSSTRTDS